MMGDVLTSTLAPRMLGRITFGLLGIVAALSTAFAFNPTQPPSLRQLNIQYRLYEGIPGRLDQSKVIGTPCLVVLECHAGSFMSGGGEIRKEKLPPESAEFTWGTICKVCLGRIQNRQIPLDLTFTHTTRADPDSETVVVQGYSHRVLRTVQLNEKITIAIPGKEKSKHWIELHLTERVQSEIEDTR